MVANRLITKRLALKLLVVACSLGTLLIVVAGCSTRGFIKSRSRVIEEAASQGTYLPSIEEDRMYFKSTEDNQKRRLLALIRKRARSGERDTTYRLGPGDEIEINVFDVPELNLTTHVKQSGFVSLPLVGAIKATGLTEGDFTDELRQRLSAYIRSPQVSTFISNYNGHQVAVIGAVQTPGNYPLKKGASSLLELISKAGGLTQRAGSILILVPSELTGLNADSDLEARAKLALASEEKDIKDSGIEIFLDQVMGTAGSIPIEVPIRGGDMLIIPDAGKAMVEGEVKTPGSYDLGPQFTVLSALAAAGGITYGAKVDEIELIRELSPNKKARLVLDLEKIGSGEEHDVRLRNGDIVRVPSDSTRRLGQDTYESISRIINFGVGGTVSVVK